MNIIEGVKENNQKDWEIARWTILHIISPHAKRKLTIKDIAIFPWEKKKIDIIKDQERALRLSKKWDKWKKHS